MEIKINGNVVLGIGEMHYLAMRCIFEKSKVSCEEQKALEHSITWWSKNQVNLDKTTRWECKRIVNALVADRDYGRFDRAKEIMIEGKMDWHRFYKAGLPFIPDENVKIRKH